MTKITKILIGVGVMAVVAVATVLIIRYIKKNKQQKAIDAVNAGAKKDVAQSANNSSNTNTSFSGRDNTQDGSDNGYPITYNVYSEDAKLLQKALGVTQDGYIGPKTLKAWQKIAPAINEGFKIADRNALDSFIDMVNNSTKTDALNYVDIGTGLLDFWKTGIMF